MKRSSLSLLFYFGLATVAIGYLLLLWTLGGIERLMKLWSALPTVAGLVLLGFFLFHPARPRPRFLLGGLLNGLLGGFTLYVSVFWPPAWGAWLEKLWPSYMLLIGVAFVPYAFQYKKKLRVTLMIPSWALLALGAIFLLFSLRWVEGDLTGFVATWWPILVLVFGGTLLLVYWFQYASACKDETGKKL